MGNRSTILVTGASGFIGRVLARRLTGRGHEVVGVGRRRDGHGASSRWVHLPVPRDRSAVEACLESVRPDVVFHLAGAPTGPSQELDDANVAYARNLLDVVAQFDPMPLVVLAGSAAEYGRVAPGQLPVVETHECRPISDYGRTKLAQTELGFAAARGGVPVIIARLFNVIGLGIPSYLFLGRISREIGMMGAQGGSVRVGDLGVRRDVVGVDEAARVLELLMDTPGARGQVVNICTGEGVVMEDVVSRLVALADVPVEVVVDPDRRGINPVGDMIGSRERLRGLGIDVSTPDLDSELASILRWVRADDA